MSQKKNRTNPTSSKSKDSGPASAKSKLGKMAGFAEHIRTVLASTTGSFVDFSRQSAPLVNLDYSMELKIKNEALQRFWDDQGLPGEPGQVLSSPCPRHYRTTSNRKASLRGSVLYLSMGGKKTSRQQKSFEKSNLEPESHTRIYSFLRSRISEPEFRIVGKHLNYIVIRGNYREQVVIFNVDEMNGPLIRKLKILANNLQNFSDPVVAAFIYPDPSGSNYYLEEKRPSDTIKLKKLFGKNQLQLDVGGCRYLYHPTSFSQVNESILPVMLEAAYDLLQPKSQQRLIDLYCGYGLFSHYLASSYHKVVGVEADGEAIKAAIANKKSNPASRNVQFVQGSITGSNLPKLLPPPSNWQEALIIDPPRQGAKEDVLAALSLRQPEKVLHVHCNADLIPGSIREWEKQGYKPSRILPLDMFAGTANLEVLLKLEAV